MSTIEMLLAVFSVVLLHVRSGVCILSMLTEDHQMHVVDTGQAVLFDCLFFGDDYNLFDFPVLWRKTQNGEDIQVNIMGNLNEPFLSQDRFDVTFAFNPPRYNLQMTISGVIPEDSGNYTCEVRGLQSIVERQTTHHLFVRAAVRSIVMSSGDGHHSTFVNPTPHQSFHLVENRPSQLHCISLGGFPPPRLQMLVDRRRNLTAEMSSSDRTEMSGEPGMRLMLHRRELFTYNYVPSADDDGRSLSCSADVSGLRPFVATVTLDVDYSPQIRCVSPSVILGDVDALIDCQVKAKPPTVNIFWIIDANGTRLAGGEVTHSYEAIAFDVDTDVARVQLRLRRIDVDSFRTFTLVAENRVTISAKDVSLHQRHYLSARQGNADEIRLLSFVNGGDGLLRDTVRQSHLNGAEVTVQGAPSIGFLFVVFLAYLECTLATRVLSGLF